LDVALVPLEGGAEFGKVENPLEMERDIDIEVNPKNRIGLKGVKGVVKVEVFLLGAVRAIFEPEGVFFIDARAVEVDGEREKTAVLF
jgi:hypothetical protein